MRGEADVAAAAALLAEPARAALVVALTEDETLPASELAARAGVAPSTASEHLRRLVAGGFLASRKHGRHRYFSLADPAVADAVEALASRFFELGWIRRRAGNRSVEVVDERRLLGA